MAAHNGSDSESSSDDEGVSIVSLDENELKKCLAYNPTVSDPDEEMFDNIRHYIMGNCWQNKNFTKPVFVEAMKTIPVEAKGLISMIFDFVCDFAGNDPCSRRNCMQCIDAFLDGETGHPFDVNSLVPAGFSALHSVASNGDVGLVKLLLDHGADPDIAGIGLVTGDSYFEYAGNVPLEVTIYWRPAFHRSGTFCLTSEKTISELIHKLCGPHSVHDLEIIWLLAGKMKDIGPVLHRCVKKRKLTINAAALLLVAREKVLSSNIMADKEMNLQEFIEAEIAELGDEDVRLLGSDEDPTLLETSEDRRRLMFALFMIKVFEAAGDSIDIYINSNKGKVVVEEIVSLLNKDGNLKTTWESVQAKSYVKEQTFLPMDPWMSLFSKQDNLSWGPGPFSGMQNRRGISTSACLPHYCTASSFSSSARLFQGFQSKHGNCGLKFPLTGKDQCSNMIIATDRLPKSSTASNKSWITFALAFKRGIRRI